MKLLLLLSPAVFVGLLLLVSLLRTKAVEYRRRAETSARPWLLLTRRGR